MPPPDRRELVFCHACDNEWYRDESGLICPNPECGSDVVEIIEPESDPRRRDEVDPGQHPLHDHDPWNTNVPDPDEDEISESTFRTASQSPRTRSTPAHPFESLFSSFLGGTAMHGPGAVPGQQGNTNSMGNTTSTIRSWSTGGSYTISMVSGPQGVHVTRSSGTPFQGGFNGPHDDLTGIIDQVFRHTARSHDHGTQTNPQAGGPPSLHPLFSLLMGGLPGIHGNHGDVAYSQEAFDRILTALRDQHGGTEGAPPASEEAIAALPKVKLGKEHLDEQGKAECSICMDPVTSSEEVTMLPCNHWFHGDCIKSWLKEHDTCPQCRRGITPREGDQNQPRTTGQAPRNWHVMADDLQGVFGQDGQQGDSASGTNQSSNNARGERQPQRSVASVASNLLRRFTGAGPSNNSGNNNDTGGGNESSWNNDSRS